MLVCYPVKLMGLLNTKAKDLAALIARLEKDRAWLLEQIDRGNWPDLRADLADLERELGQLLTRANDELDEQT